MLIKHINVYSAQRIIKRLINLVIKQDIAMKQSNRSQSAQADIFSKIDKDYNRKAVRKFLTRRFSADEIKIICFDLGIDYDEFSHKKSLMVVDFLRWLGQKEQIHCLVVWLHEEGLENDLLFALFNGRHLPNTHKDQQTSSEVSNTASSDIAKPKLKSKADTDRVKEFIDASLKAFGGRLDTKIIQQAINDYDNESINNPSVLDPVPSP